MDKRTENKLKRIRLRLRAARFFKKNGLYAALALCLAAIGFAAAVDFAGRGAEETPAEHDYDQRLAEVTQPAGTPAPSPTPMSIKLPGRTEANAKTPIPTLAPDITVPPSATPEASIAPVVLITPVDGSVIRVYAMDFLIYSKTLDQWMTHPGVDIAAPKGAEVRTVAAGTVEHVYTDDMLGVTVVIAHENGMRTVYSNLKEAPPVAEGQRVESRAVIGCIGDTAISECADRAHLHFELWIGDSLADPQKYMTFPSMPS